MLCEGDGESQQVPLWKNLKTRYDRAGVPLATIRWVDKHCCTLPPYTVSEARISNSSDVSFSRADYRRNSAARVYFNKDMEELLDAFHVLQRIGRGCTSDAHCR